MSLEGIKRRIAFTLVNKFLSGVKPRYWKYKRILLNWAGMNIGAESKIVGPLKIDGYLEVGEHSWIGADLTVHGNGKVIIGNNCDLAPNITFLTGSHDIGNEERRAGKGKKFIIRVKDGSWVGAKSTIVGDITIGSGSIVGTCSLVNKSVENNVLVGGVPAKRVKDLKFDIDREGV